MDLAGLWLDTLADAISRLIFAGYTYYDTYYLDHPMSRTGHAAHLGGGAFGVAFYFLFLRRLGGPLGM